MKRVLRESVGVAVEVSGPGRHPRLTPDVRYLVEGLLTQLFSTENNFSIRALSQELLIQAFSRFCNCSPFYIHILKWTKFFEKRTSAPWPWMREMQAKPRGQDFIP